MTKATEPTMATCSPETLSGESYTDRRNWLENNRPKAVPNIPVDKVLNTQAVDFYWLSSSLFMDLHRRFW
jgi:hypothetical protein